MDTDYILIACGFVGLAIVYNLWVRSHMKWHRPPSASGLRGWVTRELHRGDLRALSGAASGDFGDINIDQISRLRDRGFLASGLLGQCHVTYKGRLALLLRRTVARGNLTQRGGVHSGDIAG